jgi:hypothetical protein
MVDATAAPRGLSSALDPNEPGVLLVGIGSCPR